MKTPSGAIPAAPCRGQDTGAEVAPLPAGIGHNMGPPLDGPDPELRLWRKARRRAFRSLPRETMLRRARRAEALGLTFEEVQLEVLERGRELGPDDHARAAEIRARRG